MAMNASPYVFDRAIAALAEISADQTVRDHAALVAFRGSK
jgi:hypothetical protein